MVSPDQAEKAADSLLQPSKEALDAKKEKLAKRRAQRTNIFRSLVPAAAGAAAALASLDYVGSTVESFYIGAAVGWAAGSILGRSK